MSDRPVYISTGKETVYRSSVLNVVEDTVVLPSGTKKKHITLEHPGAVVILPVRSDGKILMIEQYRHSLGRYILELPAGTLNPGEDPLECAKREICEEIGFEAQNWQPLGSVYPAPGFCTEVQYLFFASGLSPKKLDGDEDELIEIHPMRVSELTAEILAGSVGDSKSIAAFFRALHIGLFR